MHGSRSYTVSLVDWLLFRAGEFWTHEKGGLMLMTMHVVNQAVVGVAAAVGVVVEGLVEVV